MKIHNLPEAVQVAIIKAASDCAVAKINAKKDRFDGYTRYQNWFAQSLNDVISGLKAHEISEGE